MNKITAVENMFKKCEALEEIPVVIFKQLFYINDLSRNNMFKILFYQLVFNQTFREKNTGRNAKNISEKTLFFHSFHMSYYYDYYNLIWKGARS